MTLPHREVKCDQGTFLMCQLPEGDWAIHELNGDGQGYGGDVIEFLMEDGSVRQEKGPYHLSHADYEDRQYAAIQESTGINVSIEAKRFVVGNKLSSGAYNGTRKVIHDESSFAMQPLRERMKPEWKGLEILIWGRHSGRYRKVDQIMSGEVQ